MGFKCYVEAIEEGAFTESKKVLFFYEKERI